MTVKSNDKNIDIPLYYINGLNVRKARSAVVSLWWCGLVVYLVAEVKAFVSKIDALVKWDYIFRGHWWLKMKIQSHRKSPHWQRLHSAHHWRCIVNSRGHGESGIWRVL